MELCLLGPVLLRHDPNILEYNQLQTRIIMKGGSESRGSSSSREFTIIDDETTNILNLYLDHPLPNGQLRLPYLATTEFALHKDSMTTLSISHSRKKRMDMKVS